MKFHFGAAGLVLALAVTVPSAEARPVSYDGGWTVIEETDRQMTSLWTHYTVRHDFSLGQRSWWDRGGDYAVHGVQGTYLAKRWFGENYQANIYLFGGAGVAHGVGDNPADARAAGFGGVLADWETRRLFVSYKAMGIEAGSIDASAMQAARVGIAPYVANTGALHTWLMVEVDHRPENDDPIGVTPLVRFFKGPALLELGWSVTDDQPLVNFTYRF